MNLFAGLRVRGLTNEEDAVFAQLLSIWQEKRVKNLLLGVYADAHRPFQDLGISVPPQLAGSDAALDWPMKAVRALTRKHVFEGFSAGGVVDPFGVDETLEKNRFDVELLQTFQAAYRDSFAFVTTTRGDLHGGDVDDAIIQGREASLSAGIWDKRRREVGAALTILELSDSGQPVEAILFLRHEMYLVTVQNGVWSAEALGNRTGRTLVEVFAHDPQLNRPFGRSRITREVRYLTDAAIRTLVRGEVGAEFFASPQRYVLGADEDAFKDKARWSAVTGRVLALEPNEEGDIPTVGQFPQMTMSPHWEMYRQLAQNFCAATNLPQSAVGIYADNPASAEAMQAAEAQLAEDAEYQWRVFRPSLLRVHQNVLMMRGEFTNVNDLPDEAWSLNVNWTPARYVSPQASSDFVVKAVGADPALAGTSVMRRRLGLTQGEIEEVQAEIRRSRVSGLLETLRGGDVGEIDGVGASAGVDAVAESSGQ